MQSFPQPIRLVLPNLVAYYLARGYQDGTLSVSHIFHSQILWTRQAHEGNLTSLAWSHDGEQLASSGEDGMIRIWQASTGICLGSYWHHETVERLQWSSRGTLAASAAGAIQLLPTTAFVQAAAA